MILRVYGYDGAAYRSQLDAAQVNPVVTIVFNYSDEKWPADKKSLYALLKPDEGLKPFINDYRLNVIDLQFLDEKVLQALEGGFGEIVRFVASKDKKNFRFRDGIRLEHLDAVRQTLYELTKDPRYTAAIVNEKGKEAVNMCEYMDYVNSQAKAEGQLMIVHELIEEKGYTYEQAADLMKISVEEFAEKYEAFLKAQNQPEQAAEN
ncbi:MAG: hypothetical protein IKD69_13315 [Solobacterium sp.]|nr:hypothetical protein [Solobacterium sp.]